MSKKCVLSFVLSLSCCGLTLCGQTVDMRSMDFYSSRIGNMDQFFERFNGQDVPPEISKNRSDLRAALLFSCFEYDTASAHSQKVVDFITDMVNDSVSLIFDKTDWMAIAECEARLGKNDTGTVVVRMKVETDTIGWFLKWSIVSVESPLLYLDPDVRSSVLSLSPVAHELNFQELRKITTAHSKNILNYASQDFVPDMTTVFYQLVMSGRMKLGSVRHLTYLFVADGWKFTVEFYERETTNSGWLISSITKIDNDNK